MPDVTPLTLAIKKRAELRKEKRTASSKRKAEIDREITQLTATINRLSE